ncbi:MAG: SDR family oxidoreductase [Chitinophagaceae bacterium]|nr:SDR family oxidoreductase [Rubrivivax sp.]
MNTAFVTGSTGLLGNNLVRALVARGVSVRALARSPDKARRQFAGLAGVHVVQGDMAEVARFAPALSGCDVLFHTAAFFRESYTGGSHRKALLKTNVVSWRTLLEQAFNHGIRRVVNTSSIGVLDGPPGRPIDESMVRAATDADDYYFSKMKADEVLLAFLASHPELWAVMVLPGWMHGPGDAGPTSAGQFTLDYLAGRLPGVMQGSVSFVDARDVAQALIAAGERGRRGERYLAAGRHITLKDLLAEYEKVTGLPAPTRAVPSWLLWALALASEGFARLTRRPVLLSLATVRLMRREAGRTHFDQAKSGRELGLQLRPIGQTLADEVAWFRANLPPAAGGRSASSMPS